MALPNDIPYPNGFDAASFTPPDRKNARIYVDEDGLLVVDQEPLRRRASDTHPLIWRLPESQPYIFPDDTAMVFSGDALPPDFESGVFGAQKKVFLCRYTRTAAATWKFSIRVVNTETSAETTLDPTVVQR